MEKTSLEKSHSASSNALLTFICVLAVIFLTAFVAVLILKNPISEALSDAAFVGMAVATGALTLLTIVFLNIFKR